MPTQQTPRTPRRFTQSRALLLAAIAATALLSISARAETCTTQSGLSQPNRDALADAASTLAVSIQTNNAAALRASSVAEVQKSFGALQYLVALTAPKLAGTPTIEQLYVLDATGLKRNADGSAPDAQFFCSLNRSTMEADFVIPALPPGKYGFAIVTLPGAPPATQPWRLSLLLRQEPAGAQGKWLLAGFYPGALTAAGHDGLWYWTQARQFAKDKQPWNAWLYYQEAGSLLRPADFVLSTHLDKLHTETSAAAPPALSEGIGVDTPLVVKAANGDEYRFTGLGVDDSLGHPTLDIAVHLHADPLPDTATATKRNADATRALLAAYPELRKPFHGVRMIAESANAQPFATEQAMADIK